MGRLKGTDLRDFFSKCNEFHKVGGTPRQIQFVHNTHKDGDATYSIITRAYSDVLFGTMSGITRRDWTFKTNTKEERDAMYDDLVACKAEYDALFTPTPSTTDPLGQGGSSTDDKKDDEKKDGSGWLTYIVIGVAAAAIIALLIPWKKK